MYIIAIVFVIFSYFSLGLCTTEDGRLPRNLIPQHYNLRLRPNLDTVEPPFPFNGTVTIFFTCIQPTDKIIINSAGLIINEPYTLTSKNGSNAISVTQLIHNPSLQWATFSTSRPMDAGEQLRLHLEFVGHLRKPGEDGFWWDSYIYEGVYKYMAVTQLEPTSARYMFPLFDEVDMKATFNISVDHRERHLALANTKMIQSTQLPGDWMRDTFAQTPIMTPYLVAVAVGEFVYIDATAPQDYHVKIRIYATKKHIDCMKYAAEEVLYKSLAFMEKTTNMPFQLEKLDVIAYPSMGGAMENWGLITFSEPTLCINPETSNAVSKLTCAKILSHEFAHQWYGNLVTNEWWNDMWLHEGFANNYNYYPLEALGWEGSQLQQGDVERGTQQFLDTDAKNTSDPIRKNITTVQQAEGASSGSTYPKGGGMLRMIRAIMGRGAMERAFTRYLKKYQYSVVTSDNLYQELTAQAAEEGLTYPDGSPLDFKVIMEPWLNQMGFPLLNVTRVQDQVKINVIRGDKFLNPAYQNQTVSGQFGYKWPIPITLLNEGTNYTDGQEILPTSWIDINSKNTSVSIGSNQKGWFLLNAMQTFFFRVNYEESNYVALARQLSDNLQAIPDESRSQIIDDAFTLSRAGYVTIDIVMPLTSYMAKETSYNALQSTLKHAHYIGGLFHNESWFSLYQEYYVNLLLPQIQRLGWNFNNSETIQTQLFRTDAIFSSCTFFSEYCLDTAEDMYQDYKKTPNKNSIDANLMPTVLCTGVYKNDISDWLLMFGEYVRRRDSQIADERNAYLFALSCSGDQLMIEVYFQEITLGKSIAPRDLNQATQYLVSSQYGSELMWNYLDQNWTTVNPNINKFSAIATITSSWKTQDDLNRLNTLINTRPSLTTSQFNSLVQSALKVQQNIEWVNKNVDLLHRWLDQKSLKKDLLNGKIIKINNKNWRKPVLSHTAVLNSKY